MAFTNLNKLRQGAVFIRELGEIQPGLTHVGWSMKGDMAPLLEISSITHLFAGGDQLRFDQACSLANLELLQFYWKTSNTSIASITKLQKLKVFELEGDFSKVDLSPLAELPHLEELHLKTIFSRAINGNKGKLKSFRFLSRLRNLKSLEIFNLVPEEGGLYPLAEIKSLEELEILNIYSQEEYAYLRAALPNLECSTLEPCEPVESNYPACKKCDGNSRMILRGKQRGGMVCAECEKVTIQKHVDSFNTLVEKYRSELTNK